MKKILSTILMITVLFANNIFVFASSSEDSIQCCNESVYETVDEEFNVEVALRFIELGEQVSKRRVTSVLSGFKNLKQSDSRWSSEVMQSCGKTIGSAGCALTSFTMVQQYYGGTDTPKDVNTKMGSGACPFDWPTAATKYGYTYSLTTNATLLNNYVNYIKGAISSGNPVIIGMTYSGGTHFVVAYGYDDNTIIISDPASTNYQYLSQYLNNGYSIYEMITYIK